MKVAITFSVISKYEPGASTLGTAYFHHHLRFILHFTEHSPMPVPDILRKIYLLQRNIIPACSEESSGLSG
ncbi:hypothetical protein GU930_01875 [Pantoea vagans]|uniref:hypothetical protein n=1 Tax=Pantoea TaxID=53335 RepID=UPI001377E97B|nr:MULTISPECIES: hypothetical protein [Pantoea]MCT2416468.1 hypothetical protein [Pantoea sp. XY16]NBB53871.1 hypothetical protein [Pantoea vagans]QZX94822.1 hypothetical protein K6R05_13795 [Pantoea alfalfae]